MPIDRRFLLALGTLGTAAAAVVAVDQFAPPGWLHRPEQTTRQPVTLRIYYGGEKSELLRDPLVQEILHGRYAITLDTAKAGSVEQVLDPALLADKRDCRWPSNQVAYDMYVGSTGTQPRQQNIFNSPLVIFTWAPTAKALMDAGLVKKQDGVSYLTDMPKLIGMIEFEDGMEDTRIALLWLRAEVEGGWRNRLARLPLIGKLFSAVIYFYERRTRFLTIVDEIDRKARTQIRSILEYLIKGDTLIGKVEKQYYALAVLIVAGERALIRGQSEFEQQKPQTLSSGDAMLYARAASFHENLMAFDTRLMRLKISYAKAPVTGQQIKLGQAAGRATINRIQDTLDFPLADLKTAIIQVAGLYQIRKGLEDAAAVDRLEAQVQGLGQSMLEQTYKGAKQTQGDAVARVQRLTELMSRVAQLTREGQELDRQNEAARREAERVLTAAMQTYKNALLSTERV